MTTNERRFKALAKDANRQFAYAVVYGHLTTSEARDFGQWVLDNGLTHSAPLENLELYGSLNADA